VLLLEYYGHNLQNCGGVLSTTKSDFELPFASSGDGA
jgi:hypothetical protein